MDPFSVGHVSAGGDGDDVGETDAQIFAHHLVHAHAAVVAGFVRQDNADSVASFFTLDQDGITAKEFQFFHLGGGKANDRVVVVGGVIDNEAIGGAFLGPRVQNGVLHFFVFAVVVLYGNMDE